MNPIFAAAREIQELCRARGWRFCFIGGLALQRWGEPRLTQDVDLTLITGFGNEAAFVEALLAYQASRASKMSAAVQTTPSVVVERYRHTRLWRWIPKEFVFRRLRELGAFESRSLLDFGCGEGVSSVELAALGARVMGIDISPQLIEVAQRRAQLDNVEARAEFVVADITSEPLPKNEFDFLLCEAVLHHVDLRKFVPLLLDTLKPGGVFVAVEPIAYSRWLQTVRDLLPLAKDVSPGERQLDRAQVQFLSRGLAAPEVRYFDLLARLKRFLPHVNQIDEGHPFTKAFVVALFRLDRLLLRVIPGLRSLAGSVVVVGRRPVAAAAGQQ